MRQPSRPARRRCRWSRRSLVDTDPLGHACPSRSPAHPAVGSPVPADKLMAVPAVTVTDAGPALGGGGGGDLGGPLPPRLAEFRGGEPRQRLVHGLSAGLGAAP